MKYMDIIDNEDLARTLCRKLAPPLVRPCLHDSSLTIRCVRPTWLIMMLLQAPWWLR